MSNDLAAEFQPAPGYMVNQRDVQTAFYRDWFKKIQSIPTGRGDVWRDGQLVHDGFLHMVFAYEGNYDGDRSAHLRPQNMRPIAGPFPLRTQAIAAARAAWESEQDITPLVDEGG